MEELPHMISSTNAIAGIFAGIVFCCFALFIICGKSDANRKRLPPEPAGGWPLIGHLHLLSATTEPTQITLAKMADTYGPIFMLRLGLNKALVVSNWEIARECFTTNDRIFASRPKIAAGKLLGYEYAMMGAAPHGPLRSHVRKIATLELLSSRRLEQLKHIRISEVQSSIKNLYELWVLNGGNNGGRRSADKVVLVEMKKWFQDLTLNTILRMVVGKRFSTVFDDGGNEEYRKALRDFFELYAVFVPSDSFPFLEWFDFGGHKKTMRKVAKVLDEMFNKWLKEHQQKGNSDEGETEEYDFMDVMLSTVKNCRELSSYDDDTIIKATCLALILGGYDTTSITMQWALSLLLNHEEALKKVQLELDEQIGRDRRVEESDVKNLLYLQAIVKETLRLYPAAPIGIPHESIENCTVANYHICAKTRLIVNLQKLQRDPLVWEDPNEFRPERFLTSQKHLDVRGQSPQLIPFGSGRMMCPGISFGLQVLYFALANLLHMFEVGRPSKELLDMEEGVGMTSIRKNPLQIVLNPRLTAEIYE